MDLGGNIRKARQAAGMTQTQLAEALGVYAKDISRWENGVLTPNTMTFRKICETLDTSADEVLELKTIKQ